MARPTPPDPRSATTPAYAWRGLLLDICRHHISPEAVVRTLDTMAIARLNVLHLHLSDDQAHRIESRAWPRLHLGNPDDRWWTADDVRRVVDHASGVGIDVVPELDMPGHTSAWIAAYPHLCATPDPPTTLRNQLGIAAIGLDPDSEATFEFLDALLDEIVTLFGSSHLHLGGDEVAATAWPGRDVTTTQAAFTDRVVTMALDRGQTPIVWDEAWHAGLDRRAVVQVWRGHRRLRAAADAGWPVILSTPYYLDLGYHPCHHRVDPACTGEQWSARREALWADPTLDTWTELARGMEEGWEMEVLHAPDVVDRARVLGGEACLWTELCPEELLDLRLWPSLVAAADIWWTGDDPTYTDDELNDRLSRFESELAIAGIDLDRMRAQRWLDLAAGDHAIAEDLAILARCCEPSKWYSRHAALPGGRLDQPFDRFVDSLGPRAADMVGEAVRDAAQRLLDRIDDDSTTQLQEVRDLAIAVLSGAPDGATCASIGEVVVVHRRREEVS